MRNNNSSQQHVPLSLASGKSVSVLASAVGTWGSQSRRPFDVLKEHRSYCPYVVRLIVVPSLPSATVIGTSNVSDHSGGLVEEWCTMLTVIQRHNLSQYQRMPRFVFGSEGAEGAQDEELESVEAMVAGVKSKGVSRQSWLTCPQQRPIKNSKYIRGLLG